MKIQTKEIYKCEFCNKLYQIKNRCAEHEKVCSKNPDNKRACFGCVHLTKNKTTVEFDHAHREGEGETELLHCGLLKFCVYPPKTEIKGNAFATPFIENKPMPRKCPHREEEMLSIEEFITKNQKA